MIRFNLGDNLFVYGSQKAIDKLMAIIDEYKILKIEKSREIEDDRPLEYPPL